MKSFFAQLVMLIAMISVVQAGDQSRGCVNCTPVRTAQGIGNCCSSCGGQTACTTCRANEVCFRDCHGGNNPAVSCHPTNGMLDGPKPVIVPASLVH